MNFRFLKRGLLIMLLLAVMVPAAAFAGSYEFDEYGFKIGPKAGMKMAGPAAIQWEEFDSKRNVPLEKTWTVEFSGDVDMDNIEAVAIQRGSEFIPVKISIMDENKVGVTPADKFTGSTGYTLKVFLENGKNYKMDFTTVSEYRNIDVEPNSEYTDAQEMYINETIEGTITQDDYADFYRIVLPKDGKLELKAVKLDGGELNLKLYGENGDDGDYLSYVYDKTTLNMSGGLEAGTYYVKVMDSGYDGKYTLENTFTPQSVGNDSAGENYMDAQTIQANSTVQGHIGYRLPGGGSDYSDFYRIVLPQDGRLEIKAVNLDGGELNLKLYGENGDDGDYLSYVYDKTTLNTSGGLEAGTYYVKVMESGYYGGYTLENTFTPQSVGNDSAGENYMDAQQIQVNSTVQGHIGYNRLGGGSDYADFYRIVLTQGGTLEINAVNLDGGELNLKLYGENGDDGDYLSYVYDKATLNTSRELSAGTYYIKIMESGYYGGYELTTTLK